MYNGGKSAWFCSPSGEETNFICKIQASGALGRDSVAGYSFMRSIVSIPSNYRFPKTNS